jgi:serine/threonine protein phosphatase PrpC
MGLPELESCATSHIGPVREDNQDAVRLPDGAWLPEKGLLYAVADGMGGYANGALASRLALDAFFETVYENHTATTQTALRRGIESANLRIFKTSQQFGPGKMGTTLTAALIRGDLLQVAHVGDSRLYLIRNHVTTCLTNDHTTVGDLVRMRVLSPDKVRGHAQRSILTKGIGLSMFIKADINTHRLEEKDCLILCSDGLWSVIEDHEFADLAGAAPSAECLSQSLIDLALRRDTDDNISAVVIYIRRLAERSKTNRATTSLPERHSLRNFVPDQINRLLGRNTK